MHSSCDVSFLIEGGETNLEDGWAVPGADHCSELCWLYPCGLGDGGALCWGREGGEGLGFCCGAG
jgi:hypothetical protein